MMLRSASTPVLGSLLSPSFSETTPQKHPTPNQPNCTNLSCNIGAKPLSQTNSPRVCDSPIGIQRAQSEGNLESLGNFDDFAFPNKLSRMPTLEAIPSFSCQNLGGYDYEEEIEDAEEEDEELQYSSNRFSVQNMICEEVTKNVNDYRRLQIEGKMYLAAGIGVPAVDAGNGGCGGGGGSFGPFDYNRDGGDSRGQSMEEYYKSMLEENPGNPLFLRNYANFLYEKKGDLKGAEEYYSRAILADPNDGEVLSQYAKLTWELHRDEDKATAYFQRAVQASSQDSQIQASYASFLWDVDDDDGDGKENGAADDSHVGVPLFHHGGVMASATAY